MTEFQSFVVAANEEYWRAAMQEILEQKDGLILHRFQFFSHAIKGLRAKELTIFCGSTGVGKTQLLANISLDLIEQKIPQLVFSIENGPTDYVRRIMSASLGSDFDSSPLAIERAKYFKVRTLKTMVDGALELGLYEDRINVDYLIEEIRRSVERQKTQVVIIDNINFMLEPTTSAEAMLEMDRVTHKLIMFCKEVDVHIILVMHPRKSQNTRVESEYDIKGSSTAVQEAHNVWLFNRPDPKAVEDGTCSQFDRELMIAKCRRVGMATHQRFIFSTENGVKYMEKRVC